jgi:hypothetical protein
MKSYEVHFKPNGLIGDRYQIAVVASSITRAISAGKRGLEMAVGSRQAKSYCAFLVREVISRSAAA